MVKVCLATLSVLSLALASGCSGYAEMSEDEMMGEMSEEVATLEEAACANPEGVNYMLASLAAATALELKRWNTAVDFKVARVGSQDMVVLTTTGKAQCSGGVCSNVQAILDLQKPEANGSVLFADGTKLASDVFANRLISGLNEQIVCNSRPSNRGDSNCPVEEHTLVFSSATPGSCDTDFWFHAYKKGTTQALSNAKQLKNQLITFGSTAFNPYLAFDAQGDDVKVDPGPGTVGKDPATSGSCPTLSINTKYSTSDISGTCCVYGGKTLKFYRSSYNANTYTCK
jgi:hypothetical protein